MKEYLDQLEENIKPIELLKTFHVYALWDKGEIVYIGQSTQIHIRLQHHVRNKEFDSYSYFECGSRTEMDLVESSLIRNLDPRYNKTITSGFESLQRFRRRIRELGDDYKYNSEYYVPRIRKKLQDNKFELVEYNGVTSIPDEDVHDALRCMVGDLNE